MMSGFERYYQIARCFRDEAQRADRQLEFTQLDIEMAFVERDEILDLVEGLYCEIWQRGARASSWRGRSRRSPGTRRCCASGPTSPTCASASRSPTSPTSCASSRVRRLRAAPPRRAASCARWPARAARRSRARSSTSWPAFAKEWGGKGLAYLLLEAGGEVRSPIAKFLSAGRARRRCGRRPGAGDGDAIFIAADAEAVVTRVLGALRPAPRRARDLSTDDAYAFAFVVDFPLFQCDADEGRFVAEHHMFTAPKREHETLLDTDPGAVMSEAYDFVCNGLEIASRLAQNPPRRPAAEDLRHRRLLGRGRRGALRLPAARAALRRAAARRHRARASTAP